MRRNLCDRFLHSKKIYIKKASPASVCALNATKASPFTRLSFSVPDFHKSLTMTVDSGVWKFAQAVLFGPNCFNSKNSNQWMKAHTSSYQVALPRPASGKPNRRIFVIDGPMWLYEFGNPLPGGIYPKTFEQLVESQAQKIEHYLADDLCAGVVFLMDDEPPLAKQVGSERNPTALTPVTPLDLVPNFVGSRHDRGIEAWNKWTMLPSQRVGGKPSYDLGSSDPVSNASRSNFNLAMWEPTKTGNPEAYAAMQAGEISGPFFLDYLLNRDFKRMLYHRILAALTSKICVPFGRDASGEKQKKWVVLEGTNYSQLRFPDGERAEPRSELKIAYHEADTVIGHYMRVFSKKGYDVVIESTDGDFALCALMAMDSCATRADMIKNVCFPTKVYQVRHRWNTKLSSQVIDLCDMWIAVHNTFGAMAAVEGVSIENPVGTFVALAALLTNDYVRRFPQIGERRLYCAVLRNAREIFATGSLVKNHWEEPSEFKVNWETYKRLCVAVWNSLGSVDNAIDRPGESLKKLFNDEKSIAKKHGFTRDLVEVTYANLTWCLRYFNTAGYADVPVPNEFMTTVEGKSIYGYTKLSTEMDKYGSHDIRVAGEVDISSLL